MILDDIVKKQKERIEKEKKIKNFKNLKQEVLKLPSPKIFFFEESLKKLDITISFIYRNKKIWEQEFVLIAAEKYQIRD